MKKKITLIQMNSILSEPDQNYAHVQELLLKAAKEEPDIIVLPETWNTGFFPRENLKALSDQNGTRTKDLLSSFAAGHKVNIVAGSVSTVKNDHIYNTTYVFDRQGTLVSEYDKIHGFTPSGEHEFYTGGTATHNFKLDGISCSSIICYDVRFPEVIRTETIKGVDLFFVPAQWPSIRVRHWVTLNTARAIENQMFLCAINGCGYAGETRYGGNSLLLDPWGEEILHLGTDEDIQTGTIDLSTISQIRSSINVFRDRKPEYYHL